MFSLKENLNFLARERVFDELCKLITLADTDLLLRYGPILAEAVPVLKPTLGLRPAQPPPRIRRLRPYGPGGGPGPLGTGHPLGGAAP